MTSAAIQIHGAYGFLDDYPMERYYRDMRVSGIHDGTGEARKMLIAGVLQKGN